MGVMLRHIVLSLLVVVVIAACAGPDDVGTNTGHSQQTPQLDDVEILLTEPYCDLCSASDKAVLKQRAVMTRRIVELIDGASQTIDAAQFTFSVAEIADALLRAHSERNVKVRLAMDQKQGTYDSRSKALLAAGLDVRFVHGHPYGDKLGLQHAKFMIVDGRTLATGSNNWSSTGTTINEENTIIVHGAVDHPLVSAFACDFEAIWQNAPEQAADCSNEQVKFTPSSAPWKLLREKIRGAERSIDVIMHHLTYTKLVKELRKAAAAGVQVRVLLNDSTRAEHSGGEWTELQNQGGRIRYKRVNGDAAQWLHHKLVIIDDRLLINGSGNWSGSAFFNNFENYVVWEHPRVLQRFRGLYHRLWQWSFSGEALDAGIDAAEQHEAATRLFFGNLHAHFHAKDGEASLDDGEAAMLDDAGEAVPVAIPDTVFEAARHAYDHGREHLDFMALSPHTRDVVASDGEPNMTEAGFAEVVAAAEHASDGAFLALPGFEWSTNSVGNHLGVIGTRALSKTERGRFDTFYGDFMLRRELAGDRPLAMLNHPKTFRYDPEVLKGTWDMAFDINLLDIPKASERNKKFNDYGLDDFAPLGDVRDDWISGQALPDPAVVDATMANLWRASQPYVRLMEVTLNRGKELGSAVARNPSMIESKDVPGTFERRVKVHTDFDWFVSRGFRIAPAASHDNHYANWGAGHTSRTVVAAEQLDMRGFLGAVEAREVFASEDQNLGLRFYVAGRVPMGSRWATPAETLSARVIITDPDYAGDWDVRIYHGVVGVDGVQLSQQLSGVPSGRHELSLSVDGPGEHFFYLEVLQRDVDRMAWSAPIWIERL